MRKLYFFALFLVLYELATYLANDMIMPGMIQVVDQFKASQSAVALSMSLYIFGNFTFILFAGIFAEYYGKRRTLLLGNFLFLLFSFLTIFSLNIHQFMILRFLSGIGLAIIGIGYALIHSNFNDKDAIKVTALMANVAILAPLLGPLFGSIIVMYFKWHMVFIITTLMGIMSWVGLFYFAPRKEVLPTPVPFTNLIGVYFKILKHKPFIIGTLLGVFAALPILIWIAQAPNLILYALKDSYWAFAVYQLISVGGIIVSGFLMQFIAGKFKLVKLLKASMIIMIVGLTAAVLVSQSILAVSISQFVYTLGLGLLNACVYRLVMADKAFSGNMISSLMFCIQALIFVVGISITNEICEAFDFSLLSYTLSCLVLGAISLLFSGKFITLHKDRAWE